MHSGKATDCCSCFCNEQLNKNVKCGKEYFTLNVSNIVLVIFKSFITFCLGKKEDKKNRILNRNRNILVKNRNWIIFPNRSALVNTTSKPAGLWSRERQLEDQKKTTKKTPHTQTQTPTHNTH